MLRISSGVQEFILLTLKLISVSVYRFLTKSFAAPNPPYSPSMERLTLAQDKTVLGLGATRRLRFGDSVT